jgi:hypothetical protein
MGLHFSVVMMKFGIPVTPVFAFALGEEKWDNRHAGGGIWNFMRQE